VVKNRKFQFFDNAVSTISISNNKRGKNKENILVSMTITIYNIVEKNTTRNGKNTGYLTQYAIMISKLRCIVV